MKFRISTIRELMGFPKTWHLQLMVFWIATTWLASAIYLAPIIGGKEPVKQGLLVELLFGAVLLVAVGSLTGEV